MLDLILYILFGSKFEREMKRIRPIVNRINSLEAEMKKLSSDEMKAKTGEFRDRLKGGASLESLLPEAFALVREASVRTLGCGHLMCSSSGESFCTKAVSPR